MLRISNFVVSGIVVLGPPEVVLSSIPGVVVVETNIVAAVTFVDVTAAVAELEAAVDVEAVVSVETVVVTDVEAVVSVETVVVTDAVFVELTEVVLMVILAELDSMVIIE